MVAQITDAKTVLTKKDQTDFDDNILRPQFLDQGVFASLQEALLAQGNQRAVRQPQVLINQLREVAGPPRPNPELVKTLVDMGFPEARAKKVLTHFRNSLDSAMEHLTSVPPERDNDIFGPEQPQPVQRAQ